MARVWFAGLHRHAEALTTSSLHLLKTIGVSNRLHRRLVQEMSQGRHVAVVEAALVFDEALGIGDAVVQGAESAAIVSSAYGQVLVQAENPGGLLFTESFLTERSFEYVEKERNNPPIVRFRNADGETHKQGLLVDEEDAFTTFDGEDVAVPVSDYRRGNGRHQADRQCRPAALMYNG